MSAGLARLGVPTALLARVSDDFFGQSVRASLAESGVLDTYLLATSDLTALAVAHLVDGVATYSFHTAETADRGLRADHLALLPDAGELPPKAALHAGSVALVQEPQATTLEGLLRREARRRLVSLDPNVRPSLIADAGAYRRRFDGWLGFVDVVKASVEDVGWLYPGLPAEQVMDRWLSAGAALAVVTFGPDGALAATASARCRVPAPAVDVVDTVGAGDAFTAGMLAHLHSRDALDRGAVQALGEQALRRLAQDAAEIAADTCTRAGADPPWRRIA